MVMPRKASRAIRRSAPGRDRAGGATGLAAGLSSSRTAVPIVTGVVMHSLGLRAFAVPAALWFAAWPLAAQRREFTILAGANYTGATGGNLDKSERQTGFLAGVSFRMPRSARISFETELLVVQHRLSGERAPSSLPPIQVGPISDAAKLLFAQIPLLLRFQRGYSAVRPVRPFLLLGPYIGVRLACRRDVVEGDSTVRHTDCSATPNDVVAGPGVFIPAAYQNVDVGFIGSVGVEIGRIAFAGRIQRSIVDLVSESAIPTSPFDKSRLWSGSVSIEYLLRVL